MTLKPNLNQLDLPEAPSPVGAYVRGVLHGGTGYLSGQFPIAFGQLAFRGQVGKDLSLAEGKAAAALAANNVMAAIKAVVGGDLNRLARLLRVDGYVAGAPGFVDAPTVLDGASETFLQRLGDKGQHARTAIIVPALPLNSPVELVVTFAAE